MIWETEPPAGTTGAPMTAHHERQAIPRRRDRGSGRPRRARRIRVAVMQEKQTITRRDLLRILGSGTPPVWPALPFRGRSCFRVSGRRRRRLQARSSARAGRHRPASLADGAILFHEHLSARWGRPTHFSDDVALIAEEVKASRTDGVACIVDAGHPDIGRSMSALQQIATASGMPIVASGGFYTQRLYPSDISSKSVDTLADEMVRAAAAERHGALGEIGQEGEMTADEQRVFQAVGKAHVRIRLPIFTHNAWGRDRHA